MRVPTTTGLPGPARTRHQPRSIHVQLDQLPDGQLRISTPHARGWAAIARNRDQLVTAISRAFNEAAIASYSAWNQQRYDLDQLTAKDDPTEPQRRPIREQRALTGSIGYARGAVRPDVTHPGEWTPNPDGSYTSPNGRIFRDPAFIRRLESKRAKFNLPLAVPTEAAKCAVEVCDRAPKVKGWCDAHFKRWKRYGDPLGSAAAS